jgi:hypothetical protein
VTKAQHDRLQNFRSEWRGGVMVKIEMLHLDLV